MNIHLHGVVHTGCMLALISTPMFISMLFIHHSQKVKTVQKSIDAWMNKQNVWLFSLHTHIHTTYTSIHTAEYYSVLKMNEIVCMPQH